MAAYILLSATEYQYRKTVFRACKPISNISNLSIMQHFRGPLLQQGVTRLDWTIKYIFGDLNKRAGLLLSTGISCIRTVKHEMMCFLNTCSTQDFSCCEHKIRVARKVTFKEWEREHRWWHEAGRWVQPAPCRPAAAQPLGVGPAPGLLLRRPLQKNVDRVEVETGFYGTRLAPFPLRTDFCISRNSNEVCKITSTVKEVQLECANKILLPMC